MPPNSLSTAVQQHNIEVAHNLKEVVSIQRKSDDRLKEIKDYKCEEIIKNAKINLKQLN